MRWSDGRMQMSNIQGNADDLTFAGNLVISHSPFVITGDLKLGDLNLDDYRSSDASPAPKKLENRDFTRWPRVNLQLSAPNTCAGTASTSKAFTHASPDKAEPTNSIPSPASSQAARSRHP